MNRSRLLLQERNARSNIPLSTLCRSGNGLPILGSPDDKPRCALLLISVKGFTFKQSELLLR